MMKESYHIQELRHLLQNKFSFGQENAQDVQILSQKLELLSTFCNNFLQLQ